MKLVRRVATLDAERLAALVHRLGRLEERERLLACLRQGH